MTPYNKKNKVLKMFQIKIDSVKYSDIDLLVVANNNLIK